MPLRISPTQNRSLPLIFAAFLMAGCIPASVADPSLAERKAESEQTTISSEPMEISAAFPFQKQTVEVNGSTMAYVDEGEGPVVLFLHGNPTSSYLWRNIIPYVSDNHRVIAVDLIGMGDSGRPDIDYTFLDQAAYLDAFIRKLGLRDVTLVVHDWGAALGMRYARLNPDNVRGLAFMEAIIPPAFPAESYEAMGEPAGPMFQQLRTPGVGEEMVLQNNFFVEVILPQFGVVRPLTEEEMAAYRRPFPTPESRRATLAWPREIPIGGEPAAATAEVVANGEWLYSSPLPKLYFYATPGAVNPAPVTQYVIANTSNLQSVDIGAGAHFLQEDNPHTIGRSLSDWVDALP